MESDRVGNGVGQKERGQMGGSDGRPDGGPNKGIRRGVGWEGGLDEGDQMGVGLARGEVGRGRD